jgi:opacity protein-like surface antigen
MRGNEMLKLAVVVCLLLNVSSVQSQIEITKETTKTEDKERKAEKEKKEKSTSTSGATSIYFNTNWSYTTRRLIENDGLFAEPLGERANETPSNNWSFGLGFRASLHKNVLLEAGLALVQNGERYSFEDVDTMFSYRTTYSYISIPVKLLYTYGDGVKLLAGVGITPQMFMRYKQEQDWTTSNGTNESEIVKATSGFNNFALSATLSLGVQFKIADRWGLQVVPEYRMQLNSSYSKNDGYKHYATAFGGNIGLVFDF